MTRGVRVDNLEEVIRERHSLRMFLPARPVGCADPEFPANKIRVGRQPIEKNVVFVEN
jgi:hypothetical protein